MIVFDKPLNETLEKHVRDHCNLQKRIGLLGTAGFLIGSRVGEDVHVAHIAICPLPETADDRAGDMRSRLVDSEWIADHGYRIIRLLPGGVDINHCSLLVGLLWLADKKLSIEPRSVLMKALALINRRNGFTSSLHYMSPSNNMAGFGHLSLTILISLVCIETPLGKPQGYIVDCSRKGAEGSQTRVSFAQLEWISVQSSATFSLSVPIEDVTTTTNFYKVFCTAISGWTKNFFTTETALVNGCIRNGSEPLRSREKKGKANVDPVRVRTFVSAGERFSSSVPSVVNSLCVANLKANISVSAAVPSKATVQDAITAVKQHVIRSLCSRAVSELHYECTEVVEDEPKDYTSFHQLPRLACISLPTQPSIIFTDYLFEGDSKKDSQESFKDLLSIQVDEGEITEEYERHLTESDLIRFSSIGEDNDKLQKSSLSSSSQSIAAVISVASQGLTMNYIALISVIVALFAIVAYLLTRSLSE
ncbi:unnamed protein product [Enterobius vermicularis]|uniref:Protein odr-4 homolog n=1 Tax=Enterobius vermicularis TaxID=51028 RepID=A0A0N4V782_ENTVE|nr:unnamed protein product [Enterobius vermicularis]